MNIILRILIIFLGFGSQLNGQSIIEDIEKVLIRDSIIFGEIKLGFERDIEVKSDSKRYFVFNIKNKHENGLLIYTPRKYYIFDRHNDEIHKLEMKERFEFKSNFKFAKFYNSKLILVYEEITQTNYYIDQFNIFGSKISSRKGICPALNVCKCYNLESNYIVWIEYDGGDIMNLLDLNSSEIIVLAKLNLSLSADGNFFGSPKVELDYLNRRILIKDFININDETRNGMIGRKGFIKPIAEYKIEEDTMIFYY